MTIYEIAAEAGVSITTVSRVLNNPEKVAPKTKVKVEAVLKKHNYFPNAFARGLVSNSMKTVGILLTDIRNRHFSTAAYVLENCFFNWDYSTILCNTGDDLEKKKKYIQILSGKKVDGIVMLGSIFESNEIKQTLLEILPNTPVVISNGTLDMPNTYSVSIDHDYGMMLAVSHLLQNGSSKICFVYSTNTPNSKRKLYSFSKALSDNNIPMNTNQVFESANPNIDFETFKNQIIKLSYDFDALIFSEDYFALKGANILKEHGLKIPEDISIIGHDNSIFSLCSQPELTTIDTKIDDMSTIVANTMNNILKGVPVGTSTIIKPELLVRGTTIKL